MNCLPLLGDSFQPWSSLLDDRSWSLNIEDSFTIRVPHTCIEGIANWDMTWMSRTIFFSSCLRYPFISSFIKIELIIILDFVLRCNLSMNNLFPDSLYRSCIWTSHKYRGPKFWCQLDLIIKKEDLFLLTQLESHQKKEKEDNVRTWRSSLFFFFLFFILSLELRYIAPFYNSKIHPYIILIKFLFLSLKRMFILEQVGLVPSS